MLCPSARSLQALASDAGSVSEQLIVKDHARTCASCQAALSSLLGGGLPPPADNRQTTARRDDDPKTPLLAVRLDVDNDVPGFGRVPADAGSTRVISADSGQTGL